MRRFSRRGSLGLVALLAGLLALLAALPVAAQSYRFPTAVVLGTATNCGLTNVIGNFQDANGNPVDGIAARIRTADGSWTALSNLSQGGAWEITLDTAAKAGLWQVWADVDGVQQSPVINIRTDGPERCGPDNPGVQTVWVQITGQPSSQTGGAVPGQPQPGPATPPPGPQPINPPAATFRFPNAQVTSTQNACGQTGFYGRVVDRNGNGVPGIIVRVITGTGTWFAASNPTDDQGNWNLGVSPENVANDWVLYVEIDGLRQSPGLAVTTTGPEDCNVRGVAIVNALFSQ